MPRLGDKRGAQTVSGVVALPGVQPATQEQAESGCPPQSGARREEIDAPIRGWYSLYRLFARVPRPRKVDQPFGR